MSSGVVLIFRDITERRQAERLIESAREYAESIVTTVREPLLVLDAELHVRSANRSFYETFQGRTRRDRRPIHLRPRGWAVGHPGVKDAARGIIATEHLVRRFRGGTRFRAYRPEDDAPQRSPLSPGGRYELILLAIEDITDRKRMETALKEADRRKDEFIAILAHELRNPLSTIGMAAQLLRNPDSEEDREWASGSSAIR